MLAAIINHQTKDLKIKSSKDWKTLVSLFSLLINFGLAKMLLWIILLLIYKCDGIESMQINAALKRQLRHNKK